jgi:N-acetylmuramoyl-L-alanine amidase
MKSLYALVLTVSLQIGAMDADHSKAEIDWLKSSVDEEVVTNLSSEATAQPYFTQLFASYKPTVVLDPGHGGKFPSKPSAHKLFFEKEMTLDISLKIADRLRKEKVKVVLTRTEDKHFAEELIPDLMKRVEYTQHYEDPLFVSIHFNWAPKSHGNEEEPSPSVRGFEVYVPMVEECPIESYLLAGCIHHELSQKREPSFGGALGNRNDLDRGIKAAKFKVIYHARWPACLLEIDFISHPDVEQELLLPEKREVIAGIIAAGILNALKEIKVHKLTKKLLSVHV